MFHVALIYTCNMKKNALASCNSYARSHRVESGVCAWYCYSPFLVNEWCNTPKYTLAVLDMFRVFCQCNLNVS